MKKNHQLSLYLSSTTSQQMAQNAVNDLAVLPGNFMFFVTIIFKNRQIATQQLPAVIDNILFVKPSAHAQNNVGHLTLKLVRLVKYWFFCYVVAA